MTTHTPGPWGVVCDSYGKVRHSKMAAVHGPDYEHVAQRIKKWDDAHLIAAAPELLAALLNIQANLTGRDCLQDRIADSLRRACDAIAKAEGRS